MEPTAPPDSSKTGPLLPEGAAPELMRTPPLMPEAETPLPKESEPVALSESPENTPTEPLLPDAL